MTLDEAAAFLKANDDFMIVSHDGPDADGLGAAYALALALRAMGKRAWPMLSDEPSPKFAFIDKRRLFTAFASEDDLPVSVGAATFVVVDTHDLGYLGAKTEGLVAQASRLLVIDHHEPRATPNPAYCLDSTASSTCEMVFYLGRILGIKPEIDAAEALFAGIVYDTGSFAWPKTSPRTFECALALTRAGVSPNAIHQRMYESSEVGALILQKMVLSSLELLCEDRVAIQVLSRSDLSASGASYEDAEDLINTPLQAGSVEVSVFFKENADGRLRCSLRSKGKVNVANIAQNFGGGGHKTASGFGCDRPLEAMKEAVLESIARALKA
jgi:phosphoesterase RecJ-like protein